MRLAFLPPTCDEQEQRVRLPGGDRERGAMPRALEARSRDGPGAARVVRDVEIALAEPGRARVARIRRDRALADEARVVAEVVVRVRTPERAGPPGRTAVARPARRRELLGRPHGRHCDQRLAVGQQRRLRHLRTPECARRERRAEAAPAVIAEPAAGGVLDPHPGRLAGGHADPVDRPAAAEAAREWRRSRAREHRREPCTRKQEAPPSHPGIEAATCAAPSLLPARARLARAADAR